MSNLLGFKNGDNIGEILWKKFDKQLNIWKTKLSKIANVGDYLFGASDKMATGMETQNADLVILHCDIKNGLSEINKYFELFIEGGEGDHFINGKIFNKETGEELGQLMKMCKEQNESFSNISLNSKKSESLITEFDSHLKSLNANIQIIVNGIRSHSFRLYESEKNREETKKEIVIEKKNMRKTFKAVQKAKENRKVRTNGEGKNKDANRKNKRHIYLKGKSKRSHLHYRQRDNGRIKTKWNGYLRSISERNIKTCNKQADIKGTSKDKCRLKYVSTNIKNDKSVLDSTNGGVFVNKISFTKSFKSQFKCKSVPLCDGKYLDDITIGEQNSNISVSRQLQHKDLSTDQYKNRKLKEAIYVKASKGFKKHPTKNVNKKLVDYVPSKNNVDSLEKEVCDQQPLDKCTPSFKEEELELSSIKDMNKTNNNKDPLKNDMNAKETSSISMDDNKISDKGNTRKNKLSDNSEKKTDEKMHTPDPKIIIFCCSPVLVNDKQGESLKTNEKDCVKLSNEMYTDESSTVSVSAFGKNESLSKEIIRAHSCSNHGNKESVDPHKEESTYKLFANNEETKTMCGFVSITYPKSKKKTILEDKSSSGQTLNDISEPRRILDRSLMNSRYSILLDCKDSNSKSDGQYRIGKTIDTLKRSEGKQFHDDIKQIKAVKFCGKINTEPIMKDNKRLEGTSAKKDMDKTDSSCQNSLLIEQVYDNLYLQKEINKIDIKKIRIRPRTCKETDVKDVIEQKKVQYSLFEAMTTKTNTTYALSSYDEDGNKDAIPNIENKSIDVGGEKNGYENGKKTIKEDGANSYNSEGVNMAKEDSKFNKNANKNKIKSDVNVEMRVTPIKTNETTKTDEKNDENNLTVKTTCCQNVATKDVMPSNMDVLSKSDEEGKNIETKINDLKMKEKIKNTDSVIQQKYELSPTNVVTLKKTSTENKFEKSDSLTKLVDTSGKTKKYQGDCCQTKIIESSKKEDGLLVIERSTEVLREMSSVNLDQDPYLEKNDTVKPKHEIDSDCSSSKSGDDKRKHVPIKTMEYLYKISKADEKKLREEIKLAEDARILEGEKISFKRQHRKDELQKGEQLENLKRQYEDKLRILETERKFQKAQNEDKFRQKESRRLLEKYRRKQEVCVDDAMRKRPNRQVSKGKEEGKPSIRVSNLNTNTNQNELFYHSTSFSTENYITTSNLEDGYTVIMNLKSRFIEDVCCQLENIRDVIYKTKNLCLFKIQPVAECSRIDREKIGKAELREKNVKIFDKHLKQLEVERRYFKEISSEHDTQRKELPSFKRTVQGQENMKGLKFQSPCNNHSFNYPSCFLSDEYRRKLNTKNGIDVIKAVDQDEYYNSDKFRRKCWLEPVGNNNSNRNNRKGADKGNFCDSTIERRTRCYDIYNREQANLKKRKALNKIENEKEHISEINDNVPPCKLPPVVSRTEHEDPKVADNMKDPKESIQKSSCCGKADIKKETIFKAEKEYIAIPQNVDKESIQGFVIKDFSQEEFEMANHDQMDLTYELALIDSSVEKSDSQHVKVEETGFTKEVPEKDKKELVIKDSKKQQLNYFMDESNSVEENADALLIVNKEFSVDVFNEVSSVKDVTDEDFNVFEGDPENSRYWPTYIYRIREENSAENFVACVLKAKSGGIGKQSNLECLPISQDRTLPNIHLWENASSIAFELKPKDSADFKFETSWKMAIPYILPIHSSKELVILALNADNSSWLEMPTFETIIEELREEKLRFVETKLEQPFGVFLVQTKTKIDSVVIDKNGAQFISSIDSRVFVSVPVNALRVSVHSTLRVNIVDTTFWKELKSKSDKPDLDQIITSSHLIDFSSKKKKLLKPGNINCFLPLNPLTKAQNEAAKKAVAPIKKVISKDDDDLLSEEQSRTEYCRIEYDLFQKSLMMKGITGELIS